MSEVHMAPFGSWKSSITSTLIAGGTVGLGQIVLDGAEIYWVEMRPAEAGRNVVVRRSADGNISDITPVPFNVRTRVHEYGGGAFTVADGIVYFSNFSDQRVCRQSAGEVPQPITFASDLRYADFAFDRLRRRIICVREDHRHGAGGPVNSLIALKLDGSGAEQELAAGNDFYAFPRLSPDGRHLAWLTWNHPNMPWDGCELWVGELVEDGTVAAAVKIAGSVEESIFQPEWSPDGVLHFVSDRSGWWNLYRWRGGTAEPLCPTEGEFGEPVWVFGLSTYAFESATRIVCAYLERGVSRLATLDTMDLKLAPIDTGYTAISYVRAAPGFAAFVGGAPTEPPSIVRLDLATGKSEVLRRSSSFEPDPGYISVPRAIEFPTENGRTAHAFFYPPTNPDYCGPEGSKPPLLVISHGGPTAATSLALKLPTQYWTSRGMGVVDVNYGGSTGYGRAYRQRLNGEWGVVDVDDCVNAARYLVEAGEADGNQLVIRGASAGGFTTLCALTFRDVFRAGASYYGVADLEALDQETHKFESHYNRTLIGPYPERRDVYRERSPIHSIDRLSCPIILFQGAEDKIVPPDQAEMMFDAVRAKGLPVAHLLFEGEQHGFRRAENIRRSLDAELYFYSKVFGFPLADPVEPVAIENL